MSADNTGRGETQQKSGEAPIAKQGDGSATPSDSVKQSGRAQRDVQSIDTDKTPATSSDQGMLVTQAATPKDAPVPATPTSTETAPFTPAERAALVKQIADTANIMQPGRQNGVQSRLTIQLHPKDWGHLTVEISVAAGEHTPGSTPVVAHLVAESPAVKAELENHLGELHKALQDAGMNLQSAVVAVQSPAAGSGAGAPGSGADPGRHHQGHWDGSFSAATNTGGGNAFGASAGSGYNGGGQGGGGNHRPYYRPAIDTTESVPASALSAATSGRLDTRA